jgi:PhnB protein
MRRKEINMARLDPYLNFNGNCEEAFNFYRSVFGGEFQGVQRYSDMPPGAGEGQQDPHSQVPNHYVMHISLPIGPNSNLMGSDRPEAMGAATPGNNFSISVHTSNDEETDRIFNGLAEGGQVTMPLETQFWGARFGMLTDRFGINWMVNQPVEPQG